MANEIIGTDIVVQIGIIVKDIEKTCKEFAEFFGVDMPQIIITDTYDKANTQYRGQPTQARAKLAFFKNFKNVEIELIEPDENPSTWREFLDTHDEGIHHIGVFVKGMNEKIAALKEHGMDVLQMGDYTGGRYAYIDSVKKLKFILELLENY